MKTYGLSDNLNQMEQGKIGKAAGLALFFFFPLFFFVSTQHRNNTVLFLHPNILQHAKAGTGQILEVQIDWPIYLCINGRHLTFPPSLF